MQFKKNAHKFSNINLQQYSSCQELSQVNQELQKCRNASKWGHDLIKQATNYTVQKFPAFILIEQHY